MLLPSGFPAATVLDLADAEEGKGARSAVVKPASGRYRESSDMAFMWQKCNDGSNSNNFKR